MVKRTEAQQTNPADILPSDVQATAQEYGHIAAQHFQAVVLNQFTTEIEQFLSGGGVVEHMGQILGTRLLAATSQLQANMAQLGVLAAASSGTGFGGRGTARGLGGGSRTVPAGGRVNRATVLNEHDATPTIDVPSAGVSEDSSDE